MKYISSILILLLALTLCFTACGTTTVGSHKPVVENELIVAERTPDYTHILVEGDLTYWLATLSTHNQLDLSNNEQTLDVANTLIVLGHEVFIQTLFCDLTIPACIVCLCTPNGHALWCFGSLD